MLHWRKEWRSENLKKSDWSCKEKKRQNENERALWWLIELLKKKIAEKIKTKREWNF
jgi:hypothetical protein